ncbi:MAG: hypothetical protein KKA19_03005, partial [Candidatus Margulisbacteria bacterium]|nr:hypothetical protein [Candidatus Margulisiibacteriota bacterium]
MVDKINIPEVIRFLQTPHSFILDESLTSDEKVLFQILEIIGRRRGSCSLSVSKMKCWLGKSQPTANKVLTSLEEKGYLTIERRYEEYNRPRASKFHLHNPHWYKDTTKEIKQDVINELTSLDGLNSKDIEVLLQDAKEDISKVIMTYNYALWYRKHNGDIKNLVGFMRKAIKENWNLEKKGLKG